MKRTALLAFACMACAPPAVARTPASQRLACDSDAFTTVRITIDGRPAAVRRYRVVHVARPIAIDTTVTIKSGPTGGGVGGKAGAGAPNSNASAPANGVGPMAAASNPYAY